MSKVSSFRLGSSSVRRISMRMAATLPPARKKTSRMRCARWNSTSAADDTGLLPSASGLKAHTGAEVSTSGARRRWKNSSSRPPVPNIWPKSSGSTSAREPLANG